ncbi:hypothetical protein EAG_02648 [Camponotus floridanus]|uniref:DUF4797 domain-containing protein n=1 Tax=Camponotus floridanus TaxID=104421 RepID=E2AQF7_CAMFO|nr:hypothetical protein EAG_02648 [Camponotus floridanus]
MSSDMEDSTQLTDLSDHRSQHHHRHHYHHHRGRTPVGEIGDDECSTDSGCSSSSGSTGSGKRLFRHGSGERLCRSNRSPRTHWNLERLRERATRSQERLSSSVQRSSERTLSPEDVKSLSRGGVSPSSYSSSPSDAHSSSDSDSLRPSTTETLRRAFQSLKITSSKWNKEKKHAKKSPKRILRSPVPYMYVRGLSGLPTQRINNSVVVNSAVDNSESAHQLINNSVVDNSESAHQSINNSVVDNSESAHQSINNSVVDHSESAHQSINNSVVDNSESAHQSSEVVEDSSTTLSSVHVGHTYASPTIRLSVGLLKLLLTVVPYARSCHVYHRATS